MTAEQQGTIDELFKDEENKETSPMLHNNTTETGEALNQFYNEQILSAEHTDNEITNNDGSIIETLDTDFHNRPGYIGEHSLAGSNRADYYEKRSQGMSDTEEEQEYMRNRKEE